MKNQMKYEKKVFESEVKFYQKVLPRAKQLIIIMPRFNKKAFFSLAPFSKAAHEEGKEMLVMIPNGNSHVIEILDDIWACYADFKKGVKNKATTALASFIKIVAKKVPNFEKNFKKPQLIYATKKGFKINKEIVDYKYSWFKPYKAALLTKTCKLVWKRVFALKKSETVACGFELVPGKKLLELPLEDYLDNFAIASSMINSCPGKPSMSGGSAKPSQLSSPFPTSDLLAVLKGCELDKNIKEPVFMAFKKLSSALKLNRIKIANAIFGISGKGYGGRHLFGERIGYPTKNRKSRWQSPTRMALKLEFTPQSHEEQRDPLTRIGFTETLPIDSFIESNNIDWLSMRNKNKKLQKLTGEADYLEVEGIKVKGGQTKLKVITKGRKPMRSDGDSRNIIDPEALKITKKKFGRMANIPAGEMFITPEKMIGKFVGDVVIALDQSYMLNENKPLVVEVNGDYKVISGEKKILEQLKKKKDEGMKLLKEQEKHKSTPKKIINMKKRNFNNIGEFAINTNPKASLCDYLIVNEKIAGMIHIALGSGFEADRASVYHTDIVINAKRQKLNITAINKKKRVILMKEGKLLF